MLVDLDQEVDQVAFEQCGVKQLLQTVFAQVIGVPDRPIRIDPVGGFERDVVIFSSLMEQVGEPRLEVGGFSRTGRRTSNMLGHRQSPSSSEIVEYVRQTAHQHRTIWCASSSGHLPARASSSS